MPKAILITGYHEKNSNIIHLFFRREDKIKEEVIIDDFKPYFYVKFEHGKYESLKGEKLDKIVCEYPEEVVERRKGYDTTYESDVPFVLRFLIDKKIFSAVELPSLKPIKGIVNIKPRLVYIDIENVGDQLIAWTIWDSYNDLYVSSVLADRNKITEDDNHVICYFDNEYDLTNTLCEVLNSVEPDIIGGWNIAYDVEFLKEKFRYYGFKYNFASSDYFDLYSAYMRLYKAMSTRLKDVVVDEGIESNPIEWDEAYEAWKKGDYEKMIKYNSDDVRYCVEIDKKRKLFEFFHNIKQFIGLDKLYQGENYEIVSTGTIVDTLALRFAKEMNKALPKKGSSEQIPYEGAVVLEPIPGRHKNLAVFDFARTYPTVIIALNISPETKIKKNGKVYFDKSKKGLLPLLCEYLLNERERIESEMKKYEPYSDEWLILKSFRDVVKFTTNAVYGYAGWMQSRVYDVDCASMTTGVSRDLLTYCVKYTKEELGLEVVYGDSVAKDSKIWVRYSNGKIEEVEIEKLFKNVDYVSKGGKEYCFLNDIEVLTYDENINRVVFKKVKYVMRHKTNKKMYRIWLSNKEYIDVTEDHSLVAVKNELELVKPEELKDKNYSLIKLYKKDINYVKPEKIDEIEYNDYVYDIEVEDTHTFFANGILVHNTDSVIVKIHWIDKFDPDEHIKDLIKIGEKQTKAVSKYFREKYDASKDVKMKFERFAVMGFFPPVKKRYVLRVTWEDKPCDEIVIKGFEAIRTDASKYQREFMRKLFAMILDESISEDEIRKFVKRSIDEFKNKSLEEICMRKGLSKKLSEYKSKQDYVRAAIYSNKYLGTNFEKGSKVKYVYVKSVKGLPPTDVVAFEYESQIKDKVVLDYERMINKQIYEPIKDILKQIGIFSVSYKIKKFSNFVKKR